MRAVVFLSLFILMAVPIGLTLSQEWRLPTPLGLDEYFHVPEDNSLTPEKIELGRRLFFDKLLSADRSVTCASCHKPDLAFSDGLTVSVGVGNRKGTRNAPTLINRAYGKSFFWDGRIGTLEGQVLHPIQDPVEMNLTLDELVTRLKADPSYVNAFQQAFPHGISVTNVARALASFVRTLRSGNSSFDKFQHGDREALSQEARRGLELFRGRANCVACHVGPNFTDEQFHNTGVAWHDDRFNDDGRFAVTTQEKDHGAFKTPTLREVARTAPYMHDGSRAMLEEVIEYYKKGGNKNPHLDAELRPLRLSPEETTYLIAFLKSLNGSIAQSKTGPLRQSMH